MQRAYTVTVAFDETSRCYFVASSDIDGLHAEAPSAAEIVALISDQAKAILHIPNAEIRINNLPAAGQKAASA